MPFHSVDFGSKKIRFKLQFSDRKTLGISVLPDLSVIATAPSNSVDDLHKIKAKIRKRAPWILRQQGRFSRFLPKQPDRRYVSGESHRYLGRQYRLKLIEGSPESVKVDGGYFLITIADREDKANIKKLLNNWYKERARAYFEKKIEDCFESFKKYDLGKPPIRIRQMSMRWGTCSPTGIINLNPDLIKAPSSCIEYVIIHELCHLIHPNHDRKFYQLLLRVMPDWEAKKARLERMN
jgi:predicted metal-dependent hydrolase